MNYKLIKENFERAMETLVQEDEGSLGYLPSAVEAIEEDIARAGLGHKLSVTLMGDSLAHLPEYSIMYLTEPRTISKLPRRMGLGGSRARAIFFPNMELAEALKTQLNAGDKNDPDHKPNCTYYTKEVPSTRGGSIIVIAPGRCFDHDFAGEDALLPSDPNRKLTPSGLGPAVRTTRGSRPTDRGRYLHEGQRLKKD